MEKAVEENRLKRGRSEVVQKQNQMIHLQRADGSITDNVSDLMEETTRFYNDLYSSEAGTYTHDREPNVMINRITADELTAAARHMKGRAGKSGKALIFLTPEDKDVFYDLRQVLHESTISTYPPELDKHPDAQQKPGQAVQKRSQDETLYPNSLIIVF
uniref:Uncharacterized protein n=1 Tax=Panagrolaimus davidi TaxID=227884 RepID=A0A914PX21_9BILA